MLCSQRLRKEQSEIDLCNTDDENDDDDDENDEPHIKLNDYVNFMYSRRKVQGTVTKLKDGFATVLLSSGSLIKVLVEGDEAVDFKVVRDVPPALLRYKGHEASGIFAGALSTKLPDECFDYEGAVMVSLVRSAEGIVPAPTKDTPTPRWVIQMS